MTLTGHHPTNLPAAPSRPHADHIAPVRRRLHGSFDATCGPAAVDAAVDESLRRLAGARVDAFIPVLVERHARAVLIARSRAGTPR
jgi:hypothetical protein